MWTSTEGPSCFIRESVLDFDREKSYRDDVPDTANGNLAARALYCAALAEEQITRGLAH